MLSHNVAYHLARNLIELVLEISPFKLENSRDDVFDLLMAVL